MKQPKRCLCFICSKDITETIKVTSYYRYPENDRGVIPKSYGDKDWWKKMLPRMINGAMCSTCAQKDLEVAHMETREPEIRKDEKKLLIEKMKTKFIGRLLLRFIKL